MTNWPIQAQAIAFYGDPRGNGDWNPKWYAANIVTITPPFAMFYGKEPVTRIRVHRKCAGAFLAWLNKVWENAGRDQAKIHAWGMDQFSGSMAYRSKRGGSTPSMHEFGCAIDMDAAHNQFLSHKPHFQEFFAQVVKPFLDLGGTWGADWNENGLILDERHPDGMHFQFAHVVARPIPAPGKAPAAPPVRKAAPTLATAKPSAINPRPVGNRLLNGDMTMSVLSTNNLNIASITVIAGALGDILPKIINEGSTVGWVAAGALVVAFLVQAFMPPATAKAIEGAFTGAVIPIAEQLVPAYKSELEEVAAGIHAAEAITTTTTTTTAAKPA